MALEPFGWKNHEPPAINAANLEKDRREIATYFEAEIERLEGKGGGGIIVGKIKEVPEPEGGWLLQEIYTNPDPGHVVAIKVQMKVAFNDPGKEKMGANAGLNVGFEHGLTDADEWLIEIPAFSGAEETTEGLLYEFDLHGIISATEGLYEITGAIFKGAGVVRISGVSYQPLD